MSTIEPKIHQGTYTGDLPQFKDAPVLLRFPTEEDGTVMAQFGWHEFPASDFILEKEPTDGKTD